MKKTKIDPGSLINVSGETKIENKPAENCCTYFQIFEIAPAGLLLTDINAKIIKANKSFCELVQYDSSQIIGKNSSAFFIGDNLPELKKCITKASKTNRLFKTIQVLLTSANERFLSSVEMIRIKPDPKSGYNIIFSINKIFKLNLVERIITEKESQIHKVVEGLKDGILLVNGQTQSLIYANRTFLRLFGIKPADLYKLKTSDLVSENNPDDDYHSFYDLFVGKSQNIKNFPVYRLNRKYGEVDITGCTLNIQGKKIIVGIFHDVTEYKKTTDALRLFRESVENATDAIGMSTPEGRHYYQNESFYQLFGEVGENPPATLYVDEKVGREVFDTIMAGKRWIGEVKMYSKDKKILDIFLRAYASKDPSGKVTGLVGIHTDITEEKRSREELKKQTEVLKDLNNTKNRLFSIIAHDLRSPFQSLLGSIDLLSADTKNLSDEEKQICCKSIKDTLGNLYYLIENLLHWASLQNEKTDLVYSKFNLYKSVNEYIRILQPAGHKKNIKLINLINKSAKMVTDENILRTIIQNLVTNSIKFSKPGGSVTISSRKEKSFYYISVEDMGIGMNKKTIRQIFSKDFSVTTRGTEGEKGTGLGLQICKDLAVKAGGDIVVESIWGKGSIFTVILPVKKSV